MESESTIESHGSMGKGTEGHNTGEGSEKDMGTATAEERMLTKNQTNIQGRETDRRLAPSPLTGQPTKGPHEDMEPQRNSNKMETGTQT